MEGESNMATTTVAPPASDDHRVLLAEELYQRYGRGTSGPGSLVRNFRFWRKKYAWLIVIGGAQALKRAIDIVAALTLLVCLAPSFLAVALAIKLTDGGRVL